MRRDVRFSARLCIWSVAASFALCSLLALYFGQVRAYRQLVAYDQSRAYDTAATVDATLTRMQATGLSFANGGLAEEAFAALPGMRGIAVSDNAGQTLRHSGETIDMAALSALIRNGRTVVGTGKSTLIAFRDVDRMIAVSFEPTAIVPGALLRDTVLFSPTGVALAGNAPGRVFVAAPTPHWPVTVRVSVRKDEMPSVLGLLPLFLFGIVGPLAAAGWLVRVATAEIAWRDKIGRVVRALRLSHPRGPKLQLRLAAAERRAAEALRAQSALFAKAASEIATPLNAATGFAELIETGQPPVKSGEYAHDIATAGRNVFAQLGLMHELARIQGGEFSPQPSAFDGVDLAAAVIGENAGRAFLRRIWLEMVPSTPLQVYADERAVKRILGDLIANALKRTPKGGRIRVQLEAEASDAVFRLEDTGHPYDPAQAAGAPRRGRSGKAGPANLDLAIAAELARVMGGSLGFAQASGACRAELRLPLAPEA